MTGYPINLQIEGKSVLIIGGGKVAARKAPALLAARANLTILSPELDETFEGLSFQHIVGVYEKRYLASIKPLLVFAATNDAKLNLQISNDAREHGAIVNLVDCHEESDFHNMAILEKAPFTIGINSNASSPALLNLIKQRITSDLTEGLSQFAVLLAELRPIVRKQIPNQADRHALYQRLIDSEVLALFEAGEHEAAKARFDALVAEAL